jgi:hypothetical protein
MFWPFFLEIPQTFTSKDLGKISSLCSKAEFLDKLERFISRAVWSHCSVVTLLCGHRLASERRTRFAAAASSRPSSCWRRPGIDLTKLHFGRKIFWQIVDLLNGSGHSIGSSWMDQRNITIVNLHFTLFKFYPYITTETDSSNRPQMRPESGGPLQRDPLRHPRPIAQRLRQGSML